MRPDPAQVDLQKAPRGGLEFCDLKQLHSERFHDSDTAERLLKNVVDLSHFVLAVTAGDSNVLSDLRGRQNDKRHQEKRDQRQLPIEVQNYAQQSDKCEGLAQRIRRRLGDGVLDFFDVAGYGGHEPARGIIAEECHRLLDDPRIEQIAQVPHHGVAHVVDEVSGKKLRQSFRRGHGDNRDGDHRPHVVDTRWEEILQINRVTRKRPVEEQNRRGT